MVVGAGHGKDRIRETGLLQAQKYRVGAEFRAESTLAQLHIGAARILFRIWIANLGAFAAAAFKHAQHVAGLRNFPTGQRIEVRSDALGTRLILRWRRERQQPLRDSIWRIALAEMRGLVCKSAVVIKRGGPKHSPVGHHAGLYREHFLGVAASLSAGFLGDTKIAGIDEANIFLALLHPIGVGPYGVG